MMKRLILDTLKTGGVVSVSFGGTERVFHNLASDQPSEEHLIGFTISGNKTVFINLLSVETITIER